MFERYTECAKRALAFARYEASQMGAASVRSEDILLGLTREPEDVFVELLSMSGLDVEELRRRVERLCFRRKRTTPLGEVGITGEAQRVLFRAVEECEALGHKDVGTVHILLGLLREEEGVAARVLSDCGLELDSMRGNVRAQVAARAERLEKAKTIDALRCLLEALFEVQSTVVLTAGDARAIAETFETLERDVGPEIALVVHGGGVVVASQDRVAAPLAAWIKDAALDDNVGRAGEGITIVEGPGGRHGVMTWLGSSEFVLIVGTGSTPKDALVLGARTAVESLRQALVRCTDPDSRE